MNEQAEPFRPGIYKHFKGGFYEALAVVKHSETNEDMVLYRSRSGNGPLWVRPLTMFMSKAAGANGFTVQRFVYRAPLEQPIRLP